MLKIKDDVDLSTLEQFGFKPSEDDEDGYIYDIIPYTKEEYSYIQVMSCTRRITCLEYVDEEYHQKAIEKLFDLILAGLVEKVEEK